ncbi:MAG: aminotransferase class I/II-fold pyridoxal phosphate-dependent enzyme [Chloroflexi bacterium]|nr:aminotransferase class I/II-fold pyridoxal phosphate-dependent enzyme [Chloroflexota bacterium]
MRVLGYRVVDMIVDHIEDLPEKRATRLATRAEMEALLREPLPENGTDFVEVLEQLEKNVFTHMAHQDHPRYFAFISGPGNYVGAMADALAAGFNVFSGTWMESAGPGLIELMAIDWLRQMFQLPESAGGLFVSGGSQANLHALAVARHVKLDDKSENAVVYFSDQTHSSVERGLRVLGFQRHQIYKVHSDENYQISLSDLRRQVAEDRAAGKRPFAVIANIGGTNTGVIDPLTELADFCHHEGMWLHGDAAYGGAVILSSRKSHMLKGMDRLDSVTIDPHKWLFQPFEIGCVMVRNKRYLRDTFRLVPEYLKDVDSRSEEEVNFFDYGVQLSRGFRALKLWMSIKIFGAEAFRQAVDWGITLAEMAENKVRSLPHWEVTSPAWIGIFTFRYFRNEALSPEEEDEINKEVVNCITEDGYAFVSTTILKGRVVIRMCIINPRTTEDDVLNTIDKMNAYAEELCAQRLTQEESF